jgi:hypothetical protein
VTHPGAAKTANIADRTQRRSTDLAHALGDCVSGGEDLLGLPALSGLEFGRHW